jgi:hypothetical protein
MRARHIQLRQQMQATVRCSAATYLGQAVPQHSNHLIHADAAVAIQVQL